MNIVDLLDQYRVVIPAIQRGYVHGERSLKSEEVRRHFIAKYLSLLTDKEGEFRLDLVYGVKNGGELIPVDGQQRLTTLWLLYIALVHLYCPDCDKKEHLVRAHNFSYIGRMLAESFCQELTKSTESFMAIFGYLEREGSWLEMKFDSTVSSMCRTLKDIKDELDKSKSSEGFHWEWSVVLGALRRVSFEFSDIANLGVTASDLYVKLNARGKTLTQWENFKGQFSACLNDDVKKCFDKRIEELSDKFFKEDEKEGVKKLPDNAFFALFARVADYVIRTLIAQQPNVDFVVGDNLTALAEWTEDFERLPYVPVEEFKLEKIANAIACPLLRLMEWAIDNYKRAFPYWQKERTIGLAVFFPKNQDEHDFSLMLYGYFAKYENGQALSGNEYRSLRLVANILENVTRASKANDNVVAQFNRVHHLKLFIEGSSGLYSTSALKKEQLPLQCYEETAKAWIYASQKSRDIVLLNRCEEYMHGRVRIALFDYKEGKWNAEALSQDVASRLTNLDAKLKCWIDAKDDETKKQLLSKLIKALYWDVPSSENIPINYGPGVYREILTRPSQEGPLQASLIDIDKSLVDKSLKAVDWYDPERKWGRDEYAFDWRDTLCKWICGKINLGSIELSDSDKKLHVRWHWDGNGKGAYYLYTKTNNPGSFPIGDYRITYYSDIEFRKCLESYNVQSMQMTSSGESVFQLPGTDLFLHFWLDGCGINMRSGDKWSEIRFVAIDDIKNVGWSKFMMAISDLGKNNPKDVWDCLMKDDASVHSLINEMSKQQTAAGLY